MFNNNYYNKKTLMILLFIIVIYLAFVLPHVFSLFQADETIVIKTANGIIETGKPIFKDEIAQNQTLGLWHPPLYFYLVSIPLYFFGDNSLALRSVAILCQLISIVLIFNIIYLIVPKKKLLWASLGAFFYAINPLAIQSSIILDMDGSVLVLSMLLFTYFYIKQKNIFLLAFLFGLIFWSKFSGAIILGFSLFLFNLLKKNFSELKKIVLILFLAFSFFIISFFSYCYIFKLDFFKPFLHNSILSASLINLIHGTFNNIVRSFWSFKLFFYFVTPFLVILFFWLSFIYFKKIFKSEIIPFLFFLVSFIGMILFFIAGSSSWNFPKYYIILLPFIILFIFTILPYLKLKLVSFMNIRTLIFSFLVILFSLIFLNDPLFPEVAISVNKKYLFESAIKIFKLFFLYVLAPLFISFLCFYKIKIKDKFVYILILLVLLFSFYIDIIQLNANYSTYNLYGTTGSIQVVEYLKKQNMDGYYFAVYPHIGYYLNYNQYYDITNFYNNKTLAMHYLVDTPVLYFVVLEKDMDRISFLLDDYYRLDKQFGSYYIYKKII